MEVRVSWYILGASSRGSGPDYLYNKEGMFS